MYRSSIRGIDWPALPDAATATMFALQFQLDRTEWLSADDLAAAQRLQLRAIIAHAATTTPYYESLAPDAELADIPLLTRDALIAAGARLLTRAYPTHHGSLDDVSTSRTSGKPVRVRRPQVVTTFWRALTLRDHRWHRRDLDASLASIRYTGAAAPPPDGEHGRGWGPATQALAPAAPLSILSVASTTEQQLAWLRRVDPAYLLVYPTVLDALLRRLEPGALPALRQVRTISEALPDGLRARCAQILGVPLVDTYSAEEVGYIALQCPDHPWYHVMAERLVVEVLRADGTPCDVGEIGRVVITDLHNFATPLLRYEIGDYAEVGPPCPCGRGLPVLRRIVGRRRGMLVYPDGRTVWPLFTVACREAARYRELQLVQRDLHTLVVRVVPDGDTPVDHAALAGALRGALGAFTVEVEEIAELARSPAGKLEEFVSHVV